MALDNNKKVKKLDMDELEQVSGGKFMGVFSDSRINSIFEDKDEKQDVNNPKKGTKTNKPVVMKA